MQEQIKQKLIQHPQYRERRNKAEFIARWLRMKYPTILGSVEQLKTVESMVDEVILVERYWRRVLETNESLRGSDYSTKKKVVQEKLLDLGYTPHHYEDIKKLETL